MVNYHTWLKKMAKNGGLNGSTITVGVILAISGCSAVPTGVIPVPEEGVQPPRVVGQAPGEPVEGVVRCAPRYDGVTVCWLVTDSVTVVAP